MFSAPFSLLLLYHKKQKQILGSDPPYNFPGDQYSNRTGTLHYDLPVYVGKIDAFHKQFRLNGELLEITPDDWKPDFLGETDIQRKRRIAYEKIMKYVD